MKNSAFKDISDDSLHQSGKVDHEPVLMEDFYDLYRRLLSPEILQPETRYEQSHITKPFSLDEDFLIAVSG